MEPPTFTTTPRLSPEGRHRQADARQRGELVAALQALQIVADQLADALASDTATPVELGKGMMVFDRAARMLRDYLTPRPMTAIERAAADTADEAVETRGAGYPV